MLVDYGLISERSTVPSAKCLFLVFLFLLFITYNNRLKFRKSIAKRRKMLKWKI